MIELQTKMKKNLKLAKDFILIPVCPEILGRLPIPRERAEQKGKKVITKSGKDVAKYFQKRAKEVLKIAKIFKIKKAILKQKPLFRLRKNLRWNIFRKINER